MSHVRRYAAALAAAAAMLAMAGVAAVSSSAATKQKTYPVHSLTTSDGTRFVQTYDGRNFHARGLRDGTHRLTNGGAIRVRGGIIVWDAFGVVARSKRGTAVADLDPTG
jgi:hypothetical protein